MSILTPEQIDRVRIWHLDDCLNHKDGIFGCDVADTLAAYAEIVERVAENKRLRLLGSCPFCAEAYRTQFEEHGNSETIWNGIKHAPDCPYLAARKVRGKT